VQMYFAYSVVFIFQKTKSHYNSVRGHKNSKSSKSLTQKRGNQMDYVHNIFQFKDRCFYDDDEVVIFSDAEEKIATGKALTEARLCVLIHEYDACEKDFQTKKKIFANSMDEVLFIVSVIAHQIFNDACDIVQFNPKVSENVHTVWRNMLKNYNVVELTRCNDNFEPKKIYYNVFNFLEEKAACAAAHA